jgi:cytochrome c5
LSNSPTAWPTWTLVASGAMLVMMMTAACASAPRQGSGQAPRRPVAALPGSELPPGQGRTILQTSCTVCHDLGEVTKFRGYYKKAQWQDIVATMIGYGANVRNEDVDVLVDYLTQSLGRK